MKDNNRRDWSIGLPIVTYAMTIRCSRPTRHTPYELVFGQHPLCYFNMIEEWKQHNVNMEEDLLEDDQSITLQQCSNGIAHIKINDYIYE
ncbi:14970_t:CDS:2, partial [Cetraspora pellucida]